MQRDSHPLGAGKDSKRAARQDRLAASLRENLLRRKAQARLREAGAAADQPSPPPPVDGEVDLEAKGVVLDTGASNARAESDE